VSDFDSWLLEANASKRRRCSTCQQADLAEDIVRFLDAKAEGRTSVALEFYYDNRIALHWDIGRTAVRQHIQKCLRRDARTGKPL
jgi:hypothetical protein